MSDNNVDNPIAEALERIAHVLEDINTQLSQLNMNMMYERQRRG